jgi:hypothetical protein
VACRRSSGRRLHSRRARRLARVDAVIWHNTVTGPQARDEVVANLLRLGRADLPGPLSQLGLDRAGRWWVIADGRCNHNVGEFGNQTVGIEAFNDGTGEGWPGRQIDSWVIGTAALCRQLGLGAESVLGHREVDPGRKVDPFGVPMGRMRAFVSTALQPQAPLVLASRRFSVVDIDQIDLVIGPLDANGNGYNDVVGCGRHQVIGEPRFNGTVFDGTDPRKAYDRPHLHIESYEISDRFRVEVTGGAPGGTYLFQVSKMVTA